VIPLIMPSIIFSTVLLIILGIEQFGIPLVLLAPWGEDVLTTYLYSIYNAYVSNPYPRMAVVASIMLYITVSLLIVQRYIVLRESRRFVTIGERVRGFYVVQLSMGARVFLLVLVLLYIVFTIIVPLSSIVLRSLVPLYGSRMGSISFDAYVNILHIIEV
jgi:iron(III) transport system permease protein